MKSHSDTLPTDFGTVTEDSHWVWRLLQALGARWRPRRGWGAFLLMLGLQLLFTVSLRNTDWVDFSTAHLPPESLSLASMLFIWVVIRPHARPALPKRHLHRIGWGLAWLMLGLCLWLQQMTNLLGQWLQWSSAQDLPLDMWLQAGASFFTEVSQDSVLNLMSRFAFWFQGVQGSGAQQDDLIFIGLISLVIFILTAQACWMFVAGYSILAAMTPSLWLYALILYYSQGPRLELVAYLACLFGCWTWNQHRSLVAQWITARADYPEGIGLDRALAVLLALVTMAVLVLVLPSIRFDTIRDWTNRLLNPVDEVTVDLGQRMFPELQSRFHGRRQSGAGGLPNSFLLGNAPDLSTRVALVVSTNRQLTEEQGFYLRGMTFQHYDGQGWSNDPAAATSLLPANTQLDAVAYPHTRDIWQFIEVRNASPVLYTIPEPVQFAVNVRPVQDRVHDQVIMYRTADRPTYSVLSAMPLWSDALLGTVPLDAYPALNDTNPLAHFLQIPPTVSERTRELAAQLTHELDTPHAKGLAVERYLRTLPYDLDVSLPGPQIEDLADHFLFDLQRGYCDYYATAFVVLMRLAGIPARFVVGYAPGYLEPYTDQWIITDAQAHSWPEIWMPGMGWIPYEPTAGRSAMARTYRPLEPDPAVDLQAAAGDPDSVTTSVTFSLDPQMWFWVGLLLLVGALTVFWRLQTRDPDPWQALLAWGQRLGQAKFTWQTEREYAAALRDTLRAQSRWTTEDQRVVEDYLQRMTEEVVVAKYAVPASDPARDHIIMENWMRLRARFWRIWIFRH